MCIRCSIQRKSCMDLKQMNTSSAPLCCRKVLLPFWGNHMLLNDQVLQTSVSAACGCSSSVPAEPEKLVQPILLKLNLWISRCLSRREVLPHWFLWAQRWFSNPNCGCFAAVADSNSRAGVSGVCISQWGTHLPVSGTSESWLSQNCPLVWADGTAFLFELYVRKLLQAHISLLTDSAYI